jgi:amino acid efflux transporter
MSGSLVVAPSPSLSVYRGIALYVGALLGPGLLLLPGLAAAEAGPASVLAWLALLVMSGLFAAVFTALGKALPSADGAAGYAAAALGERARRAVAWCFLAGVILGAPVVCLIGAGYVTSLTGAAAGQLLTCGIAALLLIAVLALALCGVRSGAAVQLSLMALLVAVITVAVAGGAHAAHAANWEPFAPHGWTSIGHAASTLMLSFVGWEAIAPLTSQFRDPARQLPRVTAAAFAITTVLYLGLAVSTIAVLGPRAATNVPLAGLLQRAVGSPGQLIAAVAAIVLTLGAVNAYVSGATTMAASLSGRGSGARRWFLLLIAVAGLVLIGLYALRLVTTAELVALPTALFLAVYLACMIAAIRTLTGRARAAAWPALATVGVLLYWTGWGAAVAALIAVTAALASSPARSRTGRAPSHVRSGRASRSGRGSLPGRASQSGRDSLPGRGSRSGTGDRGGRTQRQHCRDEQQDGIAGKVRSQREQIRCGEPGVRERVEHGGQPRERTLPGDALYFHQPRHQAQTVGAAKHDRRGNEQPRLLAPGRERGQQQATAHDEQACDAGPVGPGTGIETPRQRLDQHTGQRAHSGDRRRQRDAAGRSPGTRNAGQQPERDRWSGEHPRRHRRHDPAEPGGRHARRPERDTASGPPGERFRGTCQPPERDGHQGDVG